MSWLSAILGSCWLIKRSFRLIAGNDRLIDYGEWKKALGIRNNLTSRRMFELVDTDGSGYIDYEEFRSFIRMLRQRDLKKRLAFVFQVYDLDGDGFLTESEAKQVLEASLVEQDLNLVDDDINSLVDALLHTLDHDRDRKVCAADFVRVVSRFPGIASQLDQFTGVWLPTLMVRKPRRPEAAGWLFRFKRRLAEQWPGLTWLALYIVANVVVIAIAVKHQVDLGANYGMQTARAGGAALNFNMALVLLPMCRSLWGALRHTFVARFVKIDDMAEYHKTIGYSIIAFSIIHVAGHFINYRLTNQTIIDALLYTKAGLTGLLITLAFLIMLWGVLTRVSNREWFVLTHLLYGGFLIGLLMHGPVFWIWFILPASFFAVDALIRYFIKTRRMKVIELKSLAEGVTSVLLRKPKRMNFYPGDFVRLQIPKISAHEWHPFTISAAPESSQFAVHVRNIGDWSGALHNLSRKNGMSHQKLTARIDGPYGAPTSSVYRSPIAVLIAGGIGVTPFASVLQSILLRHKRNELASQGKQLIYFHWLNRSQKSYEWFIDLLATAEQQLGSNRFQLRIHLTSLSHNLSNIAMQIALDAYRKLYQRDPLTSLKAVTSAGRPNWDKIFAELASQHPCKHIDVYFCGPPELADKVKSACRLQGFFFHQERFD
jgi:predicted ferric reductase/Ca2+-binding EF-hand superfamily protein